ncbi:MAG: nucleotide sugar dehydrogenase [Terriglobales bacterium]
MYIGVFGAGYLGTVISACLADFGMPVTCLDEDAERVKSLAHGEVPYYERNLTEVVRRNVRAGRLLYSTDLPSFSRRANVIYLAQDSCDQIEDYALRMAQFAAAETLLVVVTPVPVGTGSRLEARLKAQGNGAIVVSHPIFLTDGCAVEDFNWPDRILLGTSHRGAVLTLKQVYRPLVMRGVPVIVTNHETAELVRESSIAFYATKISFINELSALCEHVNADAVDLALALGLDKKIAPRCLQPGAAFGGPFAEMQMEALAGLARGQGIDLKILSAAREVNRAFSDCISSKIARALDSLEGAELGVLGLAFKPNTNSVAGSSSISLVRNLTTRGAQVRAYDPVAMPAAMRELDDTVKYCQNAYAAADAADAIIVSTGWPEFRALDFDRIRRLLKRPIIVDTKNLLDSERLRSMGFQYVGMGRA